MCRKGAFMHCIYSTKHLIQQIFLLSFLALGLIYVPSDAAVAQTLPDIPPTLSTALAPLSVEQLGQALTGRSDTPSNCLTYSSTTVAPEIAALAQNLKNDPDLIFEYVYDQITTLPQMGSLKGPLGALIDQSGTPFDQAELMAQLLVEAQKNNPAISNVNIQVGAVAIGQPMISDWLGTDSNPNSVQAALAAGGMFAIISVDQSGQVDGLQLSSWPWVQVSINGTPYVFDPSTKDYSRKHGWGAAALASAMGYSFDNYWGTVTQGATIQSLNISSQIVTLPSVKNLNRAGARSTLQGYTSQLLAALKQNNNSGDGPQDILGGTSIVKIPYGSGVLPKGQIFTQYTVLGIYVTSLPLRQTVLPNIISGSVNIYQYSAGAPSALSSVYRTTLTVSLPGAACYTLNSSDIYGHRLAVQVSAGQPSLTLDSNVLVTGGGSTATANPMCAMIGNLTTSPQSALSNGSGYAVIGFCVNSLNQNKNGYFTASIPIPTAPNIAYYLIGNTWGPMSRAMLERHRTALLVNKAATPNAPTSDLVLGESLSVIADTYLAQISQAFNVVDQISGTASSLNFCVGIVGFSSTQGLYVDWRELELNVAQLSRGANSISSSPPVLITPLEQSVAAVDALIGSALESGTLEQTQGPSFPAVSTVSLMDQWSASGDTIFDIPNRSIYSELSAETFSTFAYPSAAFSSFDTSFTQSTAYGAAGPRIILPSCGAISPGEFDNSCPSKNPTQKFYVYFILGQNCYTTQSSGICNAGIGSMIGSGNVIQGSNGGDQWGVLEPVETVDEETSSTDGLNVNTNSTATVIGPIGGGDSLVQGNFADPLNRVTGNFLYSHDDLTLGGGSFPYGLSFQTSYDSGSYLRNGSGFGLGWTHNFAITVTPDSDGFEGMAATSPVSGAAAIAAIVVMQDILLNTSSPPSDALPVTNLVMGSQAAQWMVEQLTNNVVAVTQPGISERFIKLTLPGGPTFIPPLKSTSTLNLTGNTYNYTTKEGVVLTFNSACFPATSTSPCSVLTWQHPAGPSVTFNYGADNVTLQSVTSSFGHSLTITHPSAQTIQVNDENQRQVTYNLDGSNNLSKFTDAKGYVTNFGYGVPGQLTSINYPTSSSPFLTNTYDQWGRVQTQEDANSHTSTFYIAGSRTELDDPRGNETVYYFDQLGNLNASIDSAGSETNYYYDGLSRLTKKTLPESNSILFTYDTSYASRFNRLSIIKCPKNSGVQCSLGNTRSYLYESHNKVKQFTNENGVIYYFLYDGLGNLTDICQPNDAACTQGHQQYAYGDATGLPTTATDAYGKLTWYAHTGGQVSRVIESGNLGGYTTNYCYDGVGNLIGIADANTAFSQCPTPNLVGPSGTVSTSFVYDNDRLLQYRFDAASTGAGTQYQYDQKGNVTAVSHQECATGANSCACPANSASCTWNNVYSYQYTPSFKLWWATDWGGKTVYTYDLADNLQTVTDPENRETTYFSDYLNRPSTVTSNLYSSPIAQYTYTPNGKIQTIADGNQHVTQYTYDEFDRLAWTLYPDNTIECNGLVVNGVCQSGYDAVGNLQSKTLRSGGTIGYAYDSLNRLWKKAPSNQNQITYNYDLVGRLTSLWDGSQSSVYGFNYNNATGRLQTTTTPTGLTLSYQYDANGNRTRLGYPNGYAALYQYDALNRLYKVTDSSDGPAFSNPLVTYQYFNDSRRASVSYRNGTSTVYSYVSDGPSGLNGIKHTFVDPTATLPPTANFSYGYDTLNVHQWSSRVIAGNSALEYSPSTQSETSTITSYSPNNVNQYVSSCTNSAGCYTGGNLTTDAAGNTYSYDTENRMLTAHTSTHSVVYTYDPKGRRVTKAVDASSTTIYLSDGTREIAEYDGNLNPLVLYVYGAGLDEPILTVNLSASGNTANFNHMDGSGSVVAQSNGGDGTLSNVGTGLVGDIYSYGPYGETNSVTGNAFRYTGRRLDPETGLYYYRARMYSPTLGRFMQNDPTGYSGGLNLYAYAGNDPINHTDPMGTNPTEVASAGSSLINESSAGNPPVAAAGGTGGGDDGFGLPGGSGSGSSPGTGFVLVGEGTLESATVVRQGEFVNRVYDSGYGTVPGVSGPLGQSFSPGSGVPTTAAEAIADRGLMIYNTNNAQQSIVYQAMSNIPALARTSLGGTAPELLINPTYFDSLNPVAQYPVVP